MIQTLEDMIRKFCAYGLELKDSDGFTHDLCTLIPALELAYKTSIHASTGKTPAMLEKGWNLKLPASSKQKWDKSHKNPEFKVGDLIIVSTLSFNNIKRPKKLKNSFLGPFFIKALHGTNAVQVELSRKLENKHPTFPVNLVKHYTSSDKELFIFRNETPLDVPPLDQSKEKKVLKELKERRLRGKMKGNTCSGTKVHNMKINGLYQK
ncbi:hypothetical protein O181_049382 [Austropuccinia psidii MF-1]|uniref:Tf2-1-like SH3-like domain-containing protein n=1 Tax=Austropuccinia psidii MF-1 TaxID=1389203 RepID=A0A9Q3HMK0_9BASI|nr:hypothetical protein [Austropuccinia psidii MF-1]